jgi:rubrerythrin
MDVFEHAMEREKIAESRYRELAEKCGNAGLSTILTMLADEELKHCEVIEQMQRTQPSLPETNLLPSARETFSKMRDQKEFDVAVSEIDIYKQAQAFEEASEQFYLEQVEAHKGKPQETVFRQLARQEAQHYWLIDSIIEFLSKPQTWLENAEFVHLDDY